MNARFGGAGGVYLPATRQELTAVMRDMNVSAGEAVVRLLEQGNPGIIARFGIEADLVKILQHPTTSIACDCGAVAGEAAASALLRHVPARARPLRPRAERADARRRRPQDDRPAGATIGLVDRGLLAVGMLADVTVFDPARRHRSRDVRGADAAVGRHPVRRRERSRRPPRRKSDRSAGRPRPPSHRTDAYASDDTTAAER